MTPIHRIHRFLHAGERALALHGVADVGDQRGRHRDGVLAQRLVDGQHVLLHRAAGGIADLGAALVLAGLDALLQRQALGAGFIGDGVDGFEQQVDALGLAEGVLLCRLQLVLDFAAPLHGLLGIGKVLVADQLDSTR
ncbi:hypothetical protein G6F59_016777 [Rhizopus arrhizus]|nr:hypothetical protein G6F59_016777 [Rhizopus arrhizus]